MIVSFILIMVCRVFYEKQSHRGQTPKAADMNAFGIILDDCLFYFDNGLSWVLIKSPR